MSAFIRRPSPVNENIVVSTCAKCGAVVGASASQNMLRIAEQTHACKKPTIQYRGKKRAQ